MVMLLARLNLHVRGKNRTTLHLLRGNRPAFQPELAQLRLNRAQVRASVHQRAQHHVAADPRKTIEIRDP